MLGNLLKKLTTAPPAQVGKRNLERAWRASMNNDMARARACNAEAAAAFRRMLEDDRNAGKRTFPARLAAAGIALLRDGDARTAAGLLDQALAARNTLFPVHAWAGLAHGLLDDRDAALGCWRRFQAVQAGQPVLGKMLSQQVLALERGEIGLPEACDAVQQALLKQDRADFRDGKPFWLSALLE